MTGPIGTFNWDSVRKLREHSPSSSGVMVATVAESAFQAPQRLVVTFDGSA